MVSKFDTKAIKHSPNKKIRDGRKVKSANCAASLYTSKLNTGKCVFSWSKAKTNNWFIREREREKASSLFENGFVSPSPLSPFVCLYLSNRNCCTIVALLLSNNKYIVALLTDCTCNNHTHRHRQKCQSCILRGGDPLKIPVI